MKTKRLLSLLLCLCMVFALLPVATITVSAAGTGSMVLGTSGIAGGGTNSVYYGKYDSTNIKWRVLNASGGNGGTYKDTSGSSVDGSDSMLLLSEYTLNDTINFGTDNTWSSSNLKAWMLSNIYNGFGVFTTLERAQILRTTTTLDSDISTVFTIEASQLSDETLFALSADEATRSAYGFGAYNSDSNNRAAYNTNGELCDWLLRSPAQGSSTMVAFIDHRFNNGGYLTSAGHVANAHGVRPALNLNLGSILFSSAASGGKASGAVGSGALTAVSSSTPTSWKMTLLDDTRNFTAVTTAVNNIENTMSIAYSGATVGTNEYISAVILDSTNNIKYYGRIAQPTAATGTTTFDTNIGPGDTIKVFSEQYNGDNETDYASALQTIPNVVNAYMVTYSLSNLAMSGSSYVKKDLGYTAMLTADTGFMLPASISVTVGGTAATLVNSTADADTAGEYYYDPSTGAIKVATVGGAVVITAAGIAKTYEISALPSSLDFGSLTAGYTLPAAQTVAITNNGNSAVTGYTVTGGGTDFDVTYTSAGVTVGGTSSFTVKPATGLAAGSHTATLTITTIESTTASVSLSFTVKAASSSGGGGNSASYYTIAATAGTGGNISPSGSDSVASGNDKTYTITPDAGYEIKDVLVDGVSVGAVSTYTFENVKKAHTITASFKKTTVNPFSDISADDWFYGNVMYAYEKGLMTGTGSDMFSPDGTMTRAMLVTVLYRLSGDTGSYTNIFSDVSSDAWYDKATAWASANGIASSIGNNQFVPDKSVTREQLAVILYNYAKYKGYDVSVGEDTNILSYDDALIISDYAFTALQWACGAGIIQGSNSNLNPGMSATRAEVAAMLERFIEKVTT